MAALTPGYLSSLSSIFSPDPSFLPPSSQPVARYRVSRVGRPKYHRVSSFFFPLSLSFPSIDKLPLVSSPHRINISASAGSRSTRQVGIENFRFFDSFSRALSKFFFFLKGGERERKKVAAIARPRFHHRGRHKSGGHKRGLLFSHYKLRKMAETGAP